MLGLCPFINRVLQKETTVDRQRINLLEMENAALKKDKAALEQNVKMLKEVIQKN